VASKVLDGSSIVFLYRALKPLIRNDEYGPRVQKRAYKVLAEICEQHHSFVAEPERLKELSALLTGTIMTSQISARSMRLKCMNLIVDGLDGDETSKEQLVSGWFFPCGAQDLFSFTTFAYCCFILDRTERDLQSDC